MKFVEAMKLLDQSAAGSVMVSASPERDLPTWGWVKRKNDIHSDINYYARIENQWEYQHAGPSMSLYEFHIDWFVVEDFEE